MITQKLIVRYHIAKQQLAIIFPYRCWKSTRSEWQPLDSDVVDVEQVDIYVCKQDDVWDISVNQDWNMGNVREYLAVRFELREDYDFVIEGKPLRTRKKSSFLCKSIPFLRCIHIKLAAAM